jgi:hypothetical protein
METPKYFDRRAPLYRRHFEGGQTYEEHVSGASDAHRARWEEMLAKTALSADQRGLLGAFTRRIHALVLSGTWCGDCIRQVPILKRIEEACPAFSLRLVDRDTHPELRDELRLNGAAKVPVVLFLTEDFFECSRMGDRTLPTYRAMAQNQLGPACPIGPAPLAQDELTAVTAEWVGEVERVQLMLRLSPFLRERHGD